MAKVDLNQLEDLEALLIEGSVVGAAQRLHLSAPAMSRRLAHLRDTFGDPLFVLAGRRLVPTERALALREPIRAVLEDARGIVVPPVVDFSRLKRTLTVRANDGFIGAWAARLVARIAVDAPGVTLHIVPRADNSMEALRSGEIDLDLGVLDAPAPEIHSQSLLKTSFVMVVRKDHPLATEPEIDVAQFVRWPHVSASRRGHAQGSIDVALRALGVQRRVAVVVPGFQAAMAMVLNSDLIAAIPEAFVQWSSERERLRVFTLPVASPSIDIAISWHPRYHADPVHRWLRAHVKAATQSASSAGKSIEKGAAFA
jgi:DNA-binding transcriptional LysR family regulator